MTVSAERPRRAERMDENKRMLLTIKRQTKAALEALPEMLAIKQWLDLDTAGKRYDPLKVSARKVMEALEQIGIDGAAYKENPTPGGE